MKDYNTGTPLGSSYNGNALYGGLNTINPLGMFMPNSSGNFLSFLGEMAFGDSNAVNNFMNEMTGVNSQQREFEQQEYLLEKEQAFALDYKSKMDAMKEAGINPLTAAAGLAGTSASPSAPAVATNTGGASAGLGAGANALNAITGGAASLADAAFKNMTANPTAEKLRNEAGLAFESMGLTAAQKDIAVASAQYADENALRDIQLKRVNVHLVAQQYKNAKATHEQILEDINLKIQQAELAGNQSEYYDQLRLRTQEETEWIKTDNEFWNAHGYNRNANSQDAIIASLIAQGIDPEPYIVAWSNLVQGEEHARAVESWNTRPTTVVEATAYAGSMVGKNLRQLFDKHYKEVGEFFSDLQANASANREFEESYQDARDDLYEAYSKARKYYRSIRYSGNTAEVANAKMRMDNAKQEYDNFTKEVFGNELIKQFSPRD